MSIFDTALQDLTRTDVQALVDGEAVENVRLEFKRDVPKRDEMLKKLSAFANTYGGHLVIGVDASTDDGKAVGLPGVEPQRNFKQTVVQWCAGGITPLIDVSVSEAIPLDNEGRRVAYVLVVPPSDNAPHFLNGRQGAYVRTDEYSKRYSPQLATADELLLLLNRRQAAVEHHERAIARAAERFEVFARGEYSTSPLNSWTSNRRLDAIGATLQLALIPRYPHAPLCDHERVIALMDEVHVQWRQTGFPTRGDIVPQHESALLPTSAGTFSLLELGMSGLVSYTVAIGHRFSRDGRGDEPMEGVHLPELLGTTLAFLTYATEVLRRLAFHGQLELVASFKRIRGVTVFAFPNNYAEHAGQSRFDDAATLARTLDSQQLQAERDVQASDLVYAMLLALGLDTSWRRGDSASVRRQLMRSAYEFSMWRLPSP